MPSFNSWIQDETSESFLDSGIHATVGLVALNCDIKEFHVASRDPIANTIVVPGGLNKDSDHN